MPTGSHARLLFKAASVLGGEEALRVFLRASKTEYADWIQGMAPLPTPLFLKLVDVLSGQDRLQKPASARRLGHRFFNADFAPGDRGELLTAALDAALFVAQADRGNVQLIDAEGALRIETQRGFDRPFLDFFARVAGPQSACGAALALRSQIFVPDVAAHALFAGTPAAAVMHAAGCAAVVSTPLLSESGPPMGMISAHFRRPRAEPDAHLELLARVAKRTASWLEASPWS